MLGKLQVDTSMASDGEQVMRPMTERARELLAMPSIASQLPVDFANGTRWEEFRGVCNGCRREIPEALLRGEVRRFSARVAIIEAIGVCPECNIGNPLFYRLHDDKRLTGPGVDGEWHVWNGRKSTFSRMLNWLRFWRKKD